MSLPSLDVNVPLIKMIYVQAIFYYFVLYFIKASFLLFYLKLFPENFTRLRIALYSTIAFTSIGVVVTFCANMFWCLPVPRNWYSTVLSHRLFFQIKGSDCIGYQVNKPIRPLHLRCRGVSLLDYS